MKPNEQKLIEELERLKRDRVIRRYNTNYNSLTDKYDIWIEWADRHAGTISGVLTVDDLRKEMASALPVKKSYKCHLCRNYIRECDGCRRGYYNSLFIPCPDFRSKEFPPTDREAVEALKSIMKETANMIGPEAEAHKYADELITYILKSKGYDDGIKIFDRLEKGYEGLDHEEEFLDFNDILPWQCLLCRYQRTFEGGCRDGLDEGYIINNQCEQFTHVETPMDHKEFLYFMNCIMEEYEDPDCECSREVVHYNMDTLMAIVVDSLGYTKFAKMYRDMDKHYLDVPF